MTDPIMMMFRLSLVDPMIDLMIMINAGGGFERGQDSATTRAAQQGDDAQEEEIRVIHH